MTDVQCAHLDQVVEGVKPSGDGCVECLRDGTPWVQLRECLTCGHVGCCDNSISKHATAHFNQTGHPIMQSYKAPTEWRWCYVDEAMV